MQPSTQAYPLQSRVKTFHNKHCRKSFLTALSLEILLLGGLRLGIPFSFWMLPATLWGLLCLAVSLAEGRYQLSLLAQARIQPGWLQETVPHPARRGVLIGRFQTRQGQALQLSLYRRQGWQLLLLLLLLTILFGAKMIEF